MTNQSPPSERDMQEFVRAAAPDFKALIAAHKKNENTGHADYPRHGCLSCQIAAGATWPPLDDGE